MKSQKKIALNKQNFEAMRRYGADKKVESIRSSAIEMKAKKKIFVEKHWASLPSKGIFKKAASKKIGNLMSSSRDQLQTWRNQVS